jgi:hypothetical protein
MNKCMMCGKNEAQEVQLPHGSINICTEIKCLEHLNHHIGGAIPVVWFSIGDLANHDEATEELIKPIMGNIEAVTKLAQEIGEYIWGGETLGTIWGEALDSVSTGTLEELYIEHLPDKALPLVVINKLHSEQAKTLLEQRLREGK